MTDRPTLVTGASGFLGRHLVRRLADEGRPVRVLERRPSDAFDGLAVERVTGDVSDPESLLRACGGVGTVFHVAGVVSHLDRDQALLHRVNVVGTEHVLEAARAAGAGRVVHVSSVASVGPAPDAAHPMDEDSAFPAFAERFGYARTKRQGEAVALAAAAAGQDVVIACPAFAIGPGDVNRVSSFTVEQYLRGALRFTLPGGLSYIDARDIIEGLLLAEAKGAAGRRYILASDDGNLSHRAFFRRVGELSGKSRLTLYLPPGVVVPSARVLARLHAPLPVKPDELASSKYYWFVANARAKAELGFSARPVDEAIEATVAWYRERGLRAR